MKTGLKPKSGAKLAQFEDNTKFFCFKHNCFTMKQDFACICKKK